jgi:hypothetical protein
VTTAVRPENMMAAERLREGLRNIIILGVLVWLTGTDVTQAADPFPYDRELLLEARPIRPAKRMPMLTVSSDGRATIDLWCRSVPALIQVAGPAIRIETAPLPESLPRYMSEGQCNERRLQADNEMLAALAQVTEWRKQGSEVVLAGPTVLKFRPSDH